MEEKKEKESLDLNKLIRFIASNWYAYLMFILALIACFYTIYNVEDYQQKINNNWMNFINTHCSCSAYYKPNVSFELQTPGDMVRGFGRSNYNTTVYFKDGMPATDGIYIYGGFDNGTQNFNNNT